MTKKKKRGKRKFTLPIAVVGGLAAGLAEPIMNIVTKGELVPSLNHIGAIYTGYNALAGQFQPDMLKRGLLPLIIGVLVHKFVGGPPLNLNRALAAANVPFIRI